MRKVLKWEIQTESADLKQSLSTPTFNDIEKLNKFSIFKVSLRGDDLYT